MLLLRLEYLIACLSLRVYPNYASTTTRWRHRYSLRFLEWRYQVALRYGGRDLARKYNYVPF